ncbi:MAG: YkgJ family cysteine cluster protein [Deltaproteobacteria bacterium]
MSDPLENYRQMLARVNDLCNGIEKALQEHLKCTQGCSSCCKAITLFPVEAAAITVALASLPTEQAAAIRHKVEDHCDDESCPLLHDNSCLLYDARPIICRTHGLPILYLENGEQHMDCCPLNLVQCKSLPGNAIIDLERLNALLVAVNAQFLSLSDLPNNFPERISIAEAVMGMPIGPGSFLHTKDK